MLMHRTCDTSILARPDMRQPSAHRRALISVPPFPHVVIENFLEPTFAGSRHPIKPAQSQRCH
jgi:hypothetical protein